MPTPRKPSRKAAQAPATATGQATGDAATDATATGTADGSGATAAATAGRDASVTGYVRPRRRPFDAERKAIYLARLETNCARIAAAAEYAEVGVETIREHRTKDPEFAAAEKSAIIEGENCAEEEARRRAVEGVERVYYGKNGEVTRIEREYSDTLLLRLLVRIQTGSWSERREIEQATTTTFATRAERLAALEKARAEVAEEADRNGRVAIPATASEAP